MQLQLTTSLFGDPRLPARFWAKVRVLDSGCWEWVAARDTYGYGQYSPVHDKPVGAHRFAYERLIGPIPPPLVTDHLCRNRACVNPEHIQPVTNRENTLRGIGPSAINAVKTHCIQGHAFDDTNTWIHRGTRWCRTCGRESTRRSTVKARIGAER